MKITKQKAQERFQHFNAICFSNFLLEVPINLTHATTFLGKMCYKKVRRPHGKPLYRDFQIRLSTAFDLPENEWDDVIVHEMIHLYIVSNRIEDTSSHGELFQKMMADFNARYGLNIVISHRQAPGSLSPRMSRRRLHLVCVSTLEDGHKGVTVCSAGMCDRIDRELPFTYKLASKEWYATEDIFFNRYPHSRLPRIYRITPEDLKEHLSDASPVHWLYSQDC